jgi:endoglucanase
MLRMLGALILVAFLLPILAGQGFVRRSGSVIVGPNGSELLLRGIGLGGWLVPEGYMLQTSGFANSPTEIRNKVVEVVGEANADLFFQTYRDNYVTRKDIEKIASWGFNSVRLPMHFNLLTPRDQPGVYLESGFVLIDSLLSWCEASRLYLILDLHAAPGSQNNDNIGDYIPTLPSLWESQSNQDRTVELWKKLAERYSSKEWIGGYDLLNEPKWNLGPVNQPLRDLYIRITSAIRQVDKNHIIFIEGNWYATDFAGLTPPWDENMAYSFHKYWNSNTQSSISSYLNLRTSSRIPLWLGESGENSNAWFTDCIALLESNNIGWSWWPHKKIESIAGPLSAGKIPEYDLLLQYWSGKVTQKPSITYALDALLYQATNLAIDQCKFHPDVIDALFRQPSTTATKPFAQNKIPGIVYAVNYDLGRNGYAYNDNDFQNTGGGTWNSGSLYRNDGVDIEACSDFPSNGYDVAWIENGEFLTFTVNVQTAGTYNINMRMAANGSTGKVRLRWDALFSTDQISVPSTGGWQSWQTMSLGQYQLEAGIHTTTLYFYNGGFNVNYLEFVKVPASVEFVKTDVREFKLADNFPNPFNPSTIIEFTLAKSGRVRLVVADLLGRPVATLFDRDGDAGNRYQVTFDASHLAAGTYISSLESNGMRLTKKMLLLK